MASFDEILSLEERAQHIEITLSECRETVRVFPALHLDLRGSREFIEKNILELNALQKTLKDAPVVLLSEYERVVECLSVNKDLLDSNKAQETTLVRRLNLAKDTMQRLEAELAVVQKKLGQYCQLVQFP